MIALALTGICAGQNQSPTSPKTFEPTVRAKTAAFETWIAQGGTPRARTVNGHTGDATYKRGPMVGKTEKQAVIMFEGIWASASDEMKDRYAGRIKIEERNEHQTEVKAEVKAEVKEAEVKDRESNKGGIYRRHGDYISSNGSSFTGGYRIKENKLYDDTGKPTHTKCGGFWIPFNSSDPEIYDPH